MIKIFALKISYILKIEPTLNFLMVTPTFHTIFTLVTKWQPDTYTFYVNIDRVINEKKNIRSKEKFRNLEMQIY